MRLLVGELVEARQPLRRQAPGGLTAASTAQPGSERCWQSLKRHSSASASMSANVSSIACPSPTVAARASRACRSGHLCRADRPADGSRWCAGRGCPSRALRACAADRGRRSRLTIVDLPTPDDPSSAPVRAGAEVLPAAARGSPASLHDTACTATSGASARTSSTRAPGSSARSALFSTMTGVAPLSHATTR